MLPPRKSLKTTKTMVQTIFENAMAKEVVGEHASLQEQVREFIDTTAPVVTAGRTTPKGAASSSSVEHAWKEKHDSEFMNTAPVDTAGHTTPEGAMETVAHTWQQKHDDDLQQKHDEDDSSIFTTFPVFMAGYTFPKGAMASSISVEHAWQQKHDDEFMNTTATVVTAGHTTPKGAAMGMEEQPFAEHSGHLKEKQVSEFINITMTVVTKNNASNLWRENVLRELRGLEHGARGGFVAPAGGRDEHHS